MVAINREKKEDAAVDKSFIRVPLLLQEPQTF